MIFEDIVGRVLRIRIFQSSIGVGISGLDEDQCERKRENYYVTDRINEKCVYLNRKLPILLFH